MTWKLSVDDLDGNETIDDLRWSEPLRFTHVLNGPGSMETKVSMSKVDRADVEPGTRNYRIYQGATLRSQGRIWRARVDTALRDGSMFATLTGEGTAGIFSRRLVTWESRYEPVTESPTNINTDYGLSQEDILWDTVDRAQLEDGGDLQIIQGSHTGGSHLRRRWWCAEDGVYLSEIFEDFGSLADGLDWAITPTLTDSSSLALVTWNPERGADLTGTVVLDGTDYLDTFDYEIDASQVVTRGRSVGTGDCEPPLGDTRDYAALATYGLLESFEASNSDAQEDADELAESQLSVAPLVGADVWYQLSRGPALGTFDVGDTIRVISPRVGWEIDLAVKVQEIEVVVQLPDDDDHTFVRVNFSDASAWGAGSS